MLTGPLGRSVPRAFSRRALECTQPLYSCHTPGGGHIAYAGTGCTSLGAQCHGRSSTQCTCEALGYTAESLFHYD